MPSGSAPRREMLFLSHIPPKSDLTAARGGWQKTWLFQGGCCFASTSACPLPVPVEQTGCLPHLLSHSCQLLLPADLLHGAHPRFIQVYIEELGRDVLEEVLRCQRLQVRL